jgi:hypothetical protein
MPVQDRYLNVRALEPAGHLDCGARMHDGVGDKLAGQQHRIRHQVVAAREPPRVQRIPHEPASGRNRLQLRREGSGSYEILVFVVHVS